MELDPAISLAFTLDANPGSYALLLGAGVSSGAVPTAWEILETLVERLAVVRGHGDGDTISWYAEEFGRAPNYGDVLEALSPSSAGRLGILRPFFLGGGASGEEASAPEPTDGHRAIARLIKMELIKVVITTNFDHLLEQALEEIGVTPTVWYTPSSMDGGIPLHQVPACIIKIHGDYMDPSFLNTGDELAAYDPAVERLIERVLDDYGLVTCGWSATWDVALRHLLEAHNSRHYRNYWVTPGTISQEAATLISQREAKLVHATSSEFFVELEQASVSLFEAQRAHPVSISVGVANVKRFISMGERIALHDLLSRALSEGVDQVDSIRIMTSGRPWDQTIGQIESAMSMALALVATTARWGNGDTDQLWSLRLVEMATKRPTGGNTSAINLTYYPETLLLYAAGVGMMIGGRVKDLEHILRKQVPIHTSNNPGPLSSELSAAHALSCLGSEREGSQRVYDVISTLLCEHLLVTEEALRASFEMFELFMALVTSDSRQNSGLEIQYVSLGIIRHEGSVFGNTARPVRVLRSMSSAGSHPWVAQGVFGGDESRFDRALQEFEQWWNARRGSFS